MQEFLSQFHKKHYKRGDVLVRAGETPNVLYAINKGKVRQYDIKPNGTELTLNIYGSPAVFSMTWGVGDIPNDFYYQVIEDCEVAVVPKDDFIDYLRTNPDEAIKTIGRLSRGLDAIVKRLDGHLSGDASKRVAIEILIELRRFGNTDQHQQVNMPIKILAARTGLARETASRQIAKLIEKDIIQKNIRNIVVNDVAKLESYIYQ